MPVYFLLRLSTCHFSISVTSHTYICCILWKNGLWGPSVAVNSVSHPSWAGCRASWVGSLRCPSSFFAFILVFSYTFLLPAALPSTLLTHPLDVSLNVTYFRRPFLTDRIQLGSLPLITGFHSTLYFPKGRVYSFTVTSPVLGTVSCTEIVAT